MTYNEVRSPQRRRLASLALVIALGMALAATACSDSKDASGSGSGTSSTVAEDLRTSDAKVAAGLESLDTTAAGINDALAGDSTQAENLIKDLEPAWRPIEGTVKANDPDTYLAIEDAFALLENGVKDGNAAKASDGADGIATAKATYLAAHPG